MWPDRVIKPRTSDLRVRCPTDCAAWPSEKALNVCFFGISGGSCINFFRVPFFISLFFIYLFIFIIFIFFFFLMIGLISASHMGKKTTTYTETLH